ncbi:MAG: BatD family protein [Flavobacteriaceae bacterium]|jgi:lipopolysaccharide export system protein LptC|nr:BatD family protein [Flavobacteriaceae bacterium]
MKRSLSILFILIFSFLAFSQVKSTISTLRIRYGEPVVLRLEVEAKKSDKVVLPALKDTLSFHLEILNRKIDTLKRSNSNTYIDSISFSGYDEGNFTVPPLNVQINSQNFATSKYRLTIDSMIVDTLKQPLYDIKPIISEPKTWLDFFKQYWVHLLVALVILLVIIALSILYYLERKKKKSGKIISTNPDGVALKKISKLEKTSYLEKGLSKKYYTELVSILKEYMENRWKFPATKLFSDDLTDYMNEHGWINDKEISKLQTLFHAADLAKFAKSRPSVEDSKMHTQLAKNFINETKKEFYNLREYD